MTWPERAKRVEAACCAGPAGVLLLGVLICAGIGSGCARDLPRPSQVPVGRPFELRAAASATLDDGLTVTFQGVRSDSRCPMDVVCISAGDATVIVRLASRDGGQAERELHTNPGTTGAANISYLSYGITLVGLAPSPRSDRPLRPEDYVATLTVERR
jgi:hypothetical protein